MQSAVHSTDQTTPPLPTQRRPRKTQPNPVSCRVCMYVCEKVVSYLGSERRSAAMCWAVGLFVEHQLARLRIFLLTGCGLPGGRILGVVII